jgi:hypothetical protein
VPLRGNVETQIRAEDASIGCGCAYPDTVPDTEVERSNAITARLREVAGELRRRASVPLLTGPELPMHAVVQVGVARIAVVHGDAWSLAGWGFAHDALHDPTTHAPLLAAFAMAAVDGFACSHTCAPALKKVAGRFVINNGAAGMANFASSAHGICTRLSALPLPRAIAGARLYGTRSAGIGIDALRVDFDVRAWLRRFDAIWPAGSPAAQSYRRRIVAGPAFTVAEALGSPVSVGVCAAAA